MNMQIGPRDCQTAAVRKSATGTVLFDKVLFIQSVGYTCESSVSPWGEATSGQ